MKIISSIVLAIVFTAGYSFAQTSVQTMSTTKSIDLEASSVKWVGKKVLGSHQGTINISSGELMMEEGNLTGGSFAIDMSSINCTDLEGEYKGKLEGHLKSADFFDVENHSMAQLNITEVSKGETAGEYKIMADLTIKGITHPVEFGAKLNDMGATADIVIDRTKYDVKYGSGSFFDNLGDNTINDEFELMVKLVH